MYNRSPLADRIRPKSFDDIVGQQKLVGKYGVLRRIVEKGSIPSMIFFGPPGTGKTTVASIMAESSNMSMYRLNATTANINDIRNIARDADSLVSYSGILLYLDEIQYFNKKQQQTLLEYLEDGRITLIASTTENPYYYIYDALLSRCMVFEFKTVAADDILKCLNRIKDAEFGDFSISDEAMKKISVAGCGDVRRAIYILEAAFNNAGKDLKVTDESVEALIPDMGQGNFDKDGDVHYDLLSGLQKSIRGSDPDAALFYLARLLEGGDLISPCRRLMVIASEDVGMAYPMAPVIVRACVENARELGLPEARIPLAHAVVLLATSPKSNSAYSAYNMAETDVHSGFGTQIPKHLKSPGFFGYKYPHDYPNHWVDQKYMPQDLAGRKYYEPGDNKFEKSLDEYMKSIKGKK